MKNSAIAVCVKTPGRSPVKTRLAEGIGKEQAEAFYRASLEQIQTTLKVAASQWGVEPYWAVAESVAKSDPIWSQFKVYGQGTGEHGLGGRLDYVYGGLLNRYNRVFLIGADSPHLDSSIFATAYDAFESGNDFVIGPTEDGGFYLFGGQRPLSLDDWCSVKYSQETTLTEFDQMLRIHGRVKTMCLNFDVDRIEDLKRLSMLNSDFSIFLPNLK